LWFRFGINNDEIKSFAYEFLTDLVSMEYIKRPQKGLRTNIEVVEYYVEHDHEMRGQGEDEEQSESEESSSYVWVILVSLRQEINSESIY